MAVAVAGMQEVAMDRGFFTASPAAATSFHKSETFAERALLGCVERTAYCHQGASRNVATAGCERHHRRAQAARPRVQDRPRVYSHCVFDKNAGDADVIPRFGVSTASFAR
jgi:hypothetical protein